MYGRAVFLGFGCIECLVARLSKLAFGYTVTYSPELQKTARGMYLLWQA
jgi:lactate dehydrogenase-like 2-hydroxyacid dehydrogenase